MSLIDTFARSAWRPISVLALVIGLAAPAFGTFEATAQAELPATAAAAPESTVIFSTIDLDFEGAQWQQTAELLARVGVPDALEQWRDEILSEGASEGDFSEADLDALLGGEMAVIVTQPAVERFVTMHMSGRGMHAGRESAIEGATPEAMFGGEPLGAAAVLLPGDPDAAWAYAERQIDALAQEKELQVERAAHGEGEVIWTEGDLSATDSDMMGDDPFEEMFGHHGHGRGAFAAGRAGDFIIAAKSPADVESIIDVIDGTAPSMVDSAAAQDVVSRLPAETLSLTYIDGQAIVESLDPEVLESLESFMPGMPREAWGGYAGLALSADDPGFRLDTISQYSEGADLDALLVANDPAVAAEAEQVPEGTFIFEAGILPPNAFAGLPYTFAQAVNAATAEAAGMADEAPLAALPSPAEIQEEIDRATDTLGFNPATDLFDLLGTEFTAFASFPQFSMEGIQLDGVAAISTTDSAALADTMSKVVDWIDQAAPDAEITERQVGEDTVYVVSDPETAEAPAIEFGVVNDQAVVAVGSGIDDLQSEPATSLADDDQFQTVMGMLPSEYYQIGYVDIVQAIGPIMMISGEFGGDEATPVAAAGGLENLRALAFVGYRQDDAAGSSMILYIAEPGS